MYTTKQKGFTIVELLIVIVVIAILAAISIVAFTGIQQRGRDSARASDVGNIVRAVTAHTTEADGSWPNDQASLDEALESNTVNLPSEVTDKVTYAAVAPSDTLGRDQYIYRGCTTGAEIYYLEEQGGESNTSTVAGTCD